MKRLLKTFVLIGSLLTMGSFASHVAQAAEVKTTKNGVTCYQQTGGAYPSNGAFFYCGSQQSHLGPVYGVAQNLGLSNPNTTEKLWPTTPVYYYVFTDCLGYYKYFSSSAPTQAQLKTYYQKSQGLSGFSYEPPQHGSIIYENVCQGTYPATVPNQQTSHTASHESGHDFDFLYGTPSYNSALFNTLANYDQKYMLANDPNGAADLQTYCYWLQYNSCPVDTSKHWAELFAEQFSVLTGGSYNGVDQVLPYWVCTRLYIQGYIQMGVPPTQTYFNNEGAPNCPAS